jgi:O-antigen/teichoic acid export membrane protein
MPEGSYWKNVTKLAGGTAVGQTVAIFAAPVLTRLYSPDDFGVMAVYASIVGIIGSLASASYHLAIPIPEDNGEAANLFGLSLILVIFVVGLTGVGVEFAGGNLAIQLGVPELAEYLWLVPLGVLGLTVYEVANQWALRQKTFAVVAKTTVAKDVMQTGTQLVIGYLLAGPVGLLIGQLVGQWLGVGSLLRSAIKLSGGVFRNISYSGLIGAAVRHSKFFLFTTPSTLLNVAGRNTPVIILAYFFGSTVAGLFALGERVLMVPVTLVAKNASQVFVVSAAQFHRNGRLAIEVENLFEQMLRIGLAPVIIFGLSSPIIFALAFGEQWTEAGYYARWFSGWLLFVFVSFALMPVILVLERQKEGMWFQGLLALGRIGSLVLGGWVGTAMSTVVTFGLVSGFLWAFYLTWLLKLSGVPLTRAVQVFSKQLVISLPFVVPVAVSIVLDTSEIITSVIVLVCVLFAFLSQSRRIKQ